MATARRVAAAMGLIAVAVVCVSGLWQGSTLEGTLLRAFVALVIFAAAGYLIGLIGAAIMTDVVRTEIDRAGTSAEIKRALRRSSAHAGGADVSSESSNSGGGRV